MTNIIESGCGNTTTLAGDEVSNEIEGKQQQFHRRIIGYFKLDEKEQKLTLDV